MNDALNVEDLRRLARRRLPRTIFEFVDGGAQDETTLRANREDFERIAFRPRVLTDVSRRRLETTLLGSPSRMPLVVAPTGLAGLLRRRGELAGARAAGAAGVPFCLSTMATCSIEETTRACDGPAWFQLYVMRDRGLTRALVERAREAGCHALVLTVDTKVHGPRERDMRNGFTVPPRFGPRTLADFLSHPRWLLDVAFGPPIAFRNFDGLLDRGGGAMTIPQFVSSQYDLALGWKDLAWFKEIWGGPVAVKGILTAEDARLAVEHGADGVIVSNHGGRQMDCAVSAIRALPEVVDAVGGSAEVILDGGVRRGADIVKALCLGARACMVGRAWLYGLAAGGEAGVARALQVLREEMDTAMALLGQADVAALDRASLAIR